jgi:hypothetical protein
LGQIVLKVTVFSTWAGEKACCPRPGTIIPEALLGRLDHPFVAGKSEIVVVGKADS